MNDDDVRPDTPSPEEEPAADATPAAAGGAPVSDETQPLSGLADRPEDPASAPPAAAEPPAQAAPPWPGSVPPATNPYDAPQPHGAPPPPNPYGTTPYPTAPPPYGQPYGGQPGQPYGGQPGQPYGQPAGAYPPPPPTNPYPQPGSFDQLETPPSPYGSPYAPTYAGGMLPDHPSATTAMVFGIIGLVGIVLCQVLLFFSPVAWVMGSRAVKQIDSEPGRYGGRQKAVAAKVMGIIGTVVLVLGIAALVALIAFGVASSSSSATYGS